MKLINNFLILIIKFYKYFISPYFPSNCRYLPTCSEYFIDSLKFNGIFAVIRSGSLASCQSLMTIALALYCTTIVSNFGTEWIAGFGIAIRLELLLIPIIFGIGGYSSFPICFAAFILRINFIIYENNLIIGKANKYLLPFSKKIFVSFKDLEGVSKKYNNKKNYSCTFFWERTSSGF